MKHRLDFAGNRRTNSVRYIASVTQRRDLDDARIFIDRKLAEGTTACRSRYSASWKMIPRVRRRPVCTVLTA